MPPSNEYEEAVAGIVRLRAAIRWHRDQVGDYRCWLDDDRVYKEASLEGCTSAPAEDAFAKLCEEFWCNRQRPGELAEAEVPTDSSAGALPPNTDSDRDLGYLSLSELEAEEARLRTGIAQHRTVPRSERRWQHDRDLYLLLPEKKLAVWRLPNRHVFLKSCAAFNRSCQQCPSKLHSW